MHVHEMNKQKWRCIETRSQIINLSRMSFFRDPMDQKTILEVFLLFVCGSPHLFPNFTGLWQKLFPPQYCILAVPVDFC